MIKGSVNLNKVDKKVHKLYLDRLNAVLAECEAKPLPLELIEEVIKFKKEQHGPKISLGFLKGSKGKMDKKDLAVFDAWSENLIKQYLSNMTASDIKNRDRVHQLLRDAGYIKVDKHGEDISQVYTLLRGLKSKLIEAGADAIVSVFALYNDELAGYMVMNVLRFPEDAYMIASILEHYSKDGDSHITNMLTKQGGFMNAHADRDGAITILELAESDTKAAAIINQSPVLRATLNAERRAAGHSPVSTPSPDLEAQRLAEAARQAELEKIQAERQALEQEIAALRQQAAEAEASRVRAEEAVQSKARDALVLAPVPVHAAAVATNPSIAPPPPPPPPPPGPGGIKKTVAGGSMAAALAAIQAGDLKLKKAETATPQINASGNNSELFAAIQAGGNLKKVTPSDTKRQSVTAVNSLMLELKKRQAALEKKVETLKVVAINEHKNKKGREDFNTDKDYMLYQAEQAKLQAPDGASGIASALYSAMAHIRGATDPDVDAYAYRSDSDNDDWSDDDTLTKN